MMGHNGYDDDEDDGVYGIGPGWTDINYEDDSVDNICAVQEAFVKQNALEFSIPYNTPIKTTDYAKTKAKVAALIAQPITELPSGTKIIKTTPKALLFLLPSRQKLWVPKAGIKQYSPCFCVASRYVIPADAPNAQYANPVQLNHVQPRCPYCGERGCDCGSTV